jgi:hypothetical protein
MKKLILLFGCLISLVISASAQYTHTFSDPVMDITSDVKSGTNAWKAMPGQCTLSTLSVGSDGLPWCVGTDQYVYSYAPSGWTKQTAMGTAVKSLAVQDGSSVYSLQSTTYCNGYPPNLGIFKWNGSSWVQPSSNSCLIQMSVGVDGFVAGVNSFNQLWYSTNGGSTWTSWSTGWRYVNMWVGGVGCAVNVGNNVYEVSSSNPAVSLGSPAAGLVGCASFPLDHGAVVTWNGAGAVYYNDDGAWHQVSGLVANKVAGSNKSSLYALNSSGYPYHLNFLAGALSELTSGIYTFQGMNPQVAQHTSTVHITFPHHVPGGGTVATERIPATGTMSNGSFDANPFCDPFIGIMSGDPECQSTTSVNEQCSEAGPIGQANQPARNISHARYRLSALANPWQESPKWDGSRWNIQVHIPVEFNCAFGNPTCIIEEVIIGSPRVMDLREMVSSANLPIAQGVANVLPSTGPWLFISAYIGTPPLCVKLSVVHDPVGGPCD